MKHTTDGTEYQFGDWQVEPRLNRLVRDDQFVDLEPRSMAVLHFLLERHNQVVTLDELLAHVWDGQVVELGSVQRHITRLRHALNDDPKAPAYIETIRKRGYRAVAPLKAFPTQKSALPTPTDMSIAVLPFDNLSPDPDNAYFAAGIHEELLTRLSKVRALHVISRTSVMEYADQPTNISAIGRALGVSNIVEGSIRRADNKVRISVQLIDARSDKHLWAETYEHALTAGNVFAIQSDIAMTIVQRLCGTLSPGDAANIDDVPTQNTKAYELYLNGNTFFRFPDGAKRLPVALEMYTQAVELDPEFALAFAALSHVHSRFYWVGLDRTEQRLRRAKQAFERAFELVPGLPEAHLAAGQYYYRGLDNYQRAMAEYTLAEAQLGGTSELAMSRAEVYRRMGKWEQSLSSWQEAIELDPRNPLPMFQYASTALFHRDYVTAERYKRLVGAFHASQNHLLINIEIVRDGDTSTMDMQESLSWLVALYARDYQAQLEFLEGFDAELYSTMFAYISTAALYGLTYELLDDADAAMAWYQKAHDEVVARYEENNTDPLLCVALGEALAGLGETNTARQLGEQAIKLRPTSKDAMIGPAIQLDVIMRIFLRAGEYERAIEELDAYLAGPGIWSIEGLLPDPRLDPIRETAAFDELARKFKRNPSSNAGI